MRGQRGRRLVRKLQGKRDRDEQPQRLEARGERRGATRRALEGGVGLVGNEQADEYEAEQERDAGQDRHA